MTRDNARGQRRPTVTSPALNDKRQWITTTMTIKCSKKLLL